MAATYEGIAISAKAKKLADLREISRLLSKWNYEIPVYIVDIILQLETEVILLEKAMKDYRGIKFRKAFYSDEFRQVFPTLDAGLPKKKENRVFQFAYNYDSDGQIIERDGTLFLLVVEPKNGLELFLRLNNDLSLDESYLDGHNCSLIDETEDDNWVDENESYSLPCDEDPSSCGVTCFNCSAGN